MKWLTAWVLLMLFSPGILFADSEVLPGGSAQIAVREHPRTGKPFVAITSGQNKNRDVFSAQKKMMKRPDYRMLDPKVKSKDTGYEGPVSDRKKVYILAASLATIGTVGGTAIIAAAPAATGTGAAGGAGVFAGAGAGVAAGTLGGTYAAAKTDDKKENFSHAWESRAVPTKT